MYFTDAGIEELDERRGDEQVTMAWLAERLRDFVDLNPEFETAVDRLAKWLARTDSDADDDPTAESGRRVENTRQSSRTDRDFAPRRRAALVCGEAEGASVPLTRYILTFPRRDISWLTGEGTAREDLSCQAGLSMRRGAWTSTTSRR